MNQRTRDAAMVLRAFNIETAKVRDVAANPDAGKLRLAWWKETVGELYEARARGRRAR